MRPAAILTSEKEKKTPPRPIPFIFIRPRIVRRLMTYNRARIFNLASRVLA